MRCSNRPCGGNPTGPKYKVLEVGFEGVLADLYDFNVECLWPADWAATMQLGYRPGKHGFIYTWKIQLSARYPNPFD